MRLLLSILLMLTMVILPSCENPAEKETDEHAEGVGIALVASGQTLVSYENDDPLVGSLSVALGARTDHINFYLIDEDGDRFIPDEEHHSLQFGFGDETIAGVYQHEGEEGGFEFHLDGLKAGQTTLTFTVYHEDHADFVSRPISVSVTQ